MAPPRRPGVLPIPEALPAGSWEQLDSVDLSEWFEMRVSMLKTCPFFLRGRLRQSFTIALREALQGQAGGRYTSGRASMEIVRVDPDHVDASPKRNKGRGRDEFAQRAHDFARGQWDRAVAECEADHSSATHCDRTERSGSQGPRGHEPSPTRPRARQELTGADLAPKTMETLAELQGRRPQVRVVDIPQEVIDFVPDRSDMKLFTQCLQSAPSGCSPGPGRCTNELLRLCLDDPELVQLLFRAADARARMPDTVMKAFMFATMTALLKPDGGGVRGIATGTSFRRLVAKCLPGSSGRQWNQRVLHSSLPSPPGQAPIVWGMWFEFSQMRTPWRQCCQSTALARTTMCTGVPC